MSKILGYRSKAVLMGRILAKWDFPDKRPNRPGRRGFYGLTGQMSIKTSRLHTSLAQFVI
jgi:hypothetical protein